MHEICIICSIVVYPCLVSRLIKYSGFGNAAGLLANNNLLGRATAASTDTVDSEDSETEEYENVKDQ